MELDIHRPAIHVLDDARATLVRSRQDHHGLAHHWIAATTTRHWRPDTGAAHDSCATRSEEQNRSIPEGDDAIVLEDTGDAQPHKGLVDVEHGARSLRILAVQDRDLRADADWLRLGIQHHRVPRAAAPHIHGRRRHVLDEAVLVHEPHRVALDLDDDARDAALERDEIVTAVHFPKPEAGAYVKFPNPASRYSMVGVFVARRPSDVRVAVTGAGSDGVFRLTAFEEALKKRFSAKSLDGLTVSADGLNSDIHGSAEYRAHLIGVLARRAVEAATAK